MASQQSALAFASLDQLAIARLSKANFSPHIYVMLILWLSNEPQGVAV